MKMTKANDSAYPSESDHHGGLTKLEYFSGLAMQGLLANNYMIKEYKPEYISNLSVFMANKLINELNEQENGK